MNHPVNCPCGSEAFVLTVIQIDDSGKLGNYYYVSCPTCNKSGERYQTREKAVKLWNDKILEK